MDTDTGNSFTVSPEILNLVPASLVTDLHVFPIGGHPSSSDEFRDECARVQLLCLRELTEKERDTLQFLVPSCSFEYITPKHESFGAYKHVTDNFWDFYEQFYPAEEIVIVPNT